MVQESSFVNYPTKTAGAIPRLTGAIKRDAITCAEARIRRYVGRRSWKRKTTLQDFSYRAVIVHHVEIISIWRASI